MRYEHHLIKSRSDLRVDTVYVHEETSEALSTPDGIGLYFFEDEEAAMYDYGVTAEECFLLTADEFEKVASE